MNSHFLIQLFKSLQNNEHTSTEQKKTQKTSCPTFQTSEAGMLKKSFKSLLTATTNQKWSYS